MAPITPRRVQAAVVVSAEGDIEAAAANAGAHEAVKVRILNQRHPSHDGARLERLYALAEGGPRWHALVDQWLPQREVEPEDIYAERRELATYVNHAGATLDLLAAMLFREAPQIEGLPDGPYYEGLLESCDGRGTPWRRWWRETFASALTGRTCYAWVNLPDRTGIRVGSRADEERAGLLDAYLVRVTAEQVLDWGTDAQGRLAWLIWRERIDERDGVDATRAARWRWTYVDATVVRRWEWRPSGAETAPHDDDDAKEMDVLEHGAGRLPVVPLEMPSALWLMHRIEDAAIAALRARCEHSWALHQSAHELLTLYRKFSDAPPELGHGHYLALGIDDRAEYVAPKGVALEYLERDVEHTREDLYRVLQAMALSVDSDSQAARQSGESKARDWDATTILLAAYRDLVISAMAETARAIMEIRRDATGSESSDVSVSGLDSWDAADLAAFMAASAMASEPAKLSPTYRRVVARAQAEQLIGDRATPEELEQIRREIAETPDADLGPEDYGAGRGGEPRRRGASAGGTSTAEG